MTIHYADGTAPTSHPSRHDALSRLAWHLGCRLENLEVGHGPAGLWVALWTFRCAGTVVATLR